MLNPKLLTNFQWGENFDEKLGGLIHFWGVIIIVWKKMKEGRISISASIKQDMFDFFLGGGTWMYHDVYIFSYLRNILWILLWILILDDSRLSTFTTNSVSRLDEIFAQNIPVWKIQSTKVSLCKRKPRTSEPLISPKIVPFFAVFHEDNLQPPEQFESGPLLDTRGSLFWWGGFLSHFIPFFWKKSGDHQLIW